MIKAKKHLGQNFLRNTSILEKIAGTDSLQDKNIIEVGPGPGDLTEVLLKRKPKSLTLIELDSDMVPLLKNRFHTGNIKLYRQDVLSMNIVSGSMVETSGLLVITDSNIITVPEYSVYGNIPYYITSPILHHFLYEVGHAPQEVIFTMQKEVADRILARDNKHSVLSLACHLVANIEKICDINPSHFVPPPKVWSTCLKFTLREYDRDVTKKILLLVKKGFSQKRKKLLSNLGQSGYDKNSMSESFRIINLSENIRAEDLTLDDWKNLYQKLA